MYVNHDALIRSPASHPDTTPSVVRLARSPTMHKQCHTTCIAHRQPRHAPWIEKQEAMQDARQRIRATVLHRWGSAQEHSATLQVLEQNWYCRTRCCIMISMAYITRPCSMRQVSPCAGTIAEGGALNLVACASAVELARQRAPLTTATDSMTARSTD
jgi:hypothetical protein